MAVIHMELVLFLAVAAILNTINKAFPLAEAFLRGLSVFASAETASKGEVAELISRRGKMTIEEAQRRAEAIVDAKQVQLSTDAHATSNGHSLRLGGQLHAATAPGFENLSVLLYSVAVTVTVTALAGLVACVRGTEQHAMSLLALLVCGGTAMYVLVVRALASSGDSTAAQRSQATLRRVGVLAAAVGVVLALLAMLAPDSVFDFSLRRGLGEAAKQASTFTALVLGKGTPTPDAPEPWLPAILLVLALLCGALTFAQVVPALLYSRSLASQLRDDSVPQWRRAVLLVAFAAPLVLAALWIRPVLGDSLLPKDLVKCSADALARDCTALPHAGELFLTETQWYSYRVLAVLAYAAMHVPVIRWHMAAHLRRGRDDQVRALVEYTSVPDESLRPGLDIFRELTALAAEPWRNINVVASSLLAPFAVLAMLALTAVRKGELEAISTCPAVHGAIATTGIDPADLAVAPERASALSELDALLVMALSHAFPGLPATRSVTLISPSLWRPLLSILTWYTLASWFVLTALALAYWQLVLSSARLKLDERAATPVPDGAAEDKGKRKKAGPKSKRRQPAKAKQS